MSFGVSYIYTFNNPDGTVNLMTSFNYPPSAVQLAEYLKKKGLQFDADTHLHVQKDHDTFIEGVTKRYGAVEAAKYRKAA